MQPFQLHRLCITMPSWASSLTVLALSCGGRIAGDPGVSSIGGSVFDAGQPDGSSDAGHPADVSVCGFKDSDAFACCSGLCCYVCYEFAGNTGAMNDCSLEIGSGPQFLVGTVAYIDCAAVGDWSSYDADAGTVKVPTAWGVDYSGAQARLVFGGALCAQLQSKGNVSVYLFRLCGEGN